jgi:hypothetical protein
MFPDFRTLQGALDKVKRCLAKGGLVEKFTAEEIASLKVWMALQDRKRRERSATRPHGLPVIGRFGVASVGGGTSDVVGGTSTEGWSCRIELSCESRSCRRW